MADKAKILAGREAVEEYRAAHTELHSGHPEGGVSAEHTPLLDTMLSKLREVGFNSVEELMAANKELCYAEINRCYASFGICDGCEGRERGCFLKCYETRPDLLLMASSAPSSQIKSPSATRAKDIYYWRHFPNLVPPNCSSRYEKVAEPEFDIYWEMPEGITLEHYQQMKQREL